MFAMIRSCLAMGCLMMIIGWCFFALFLFYLVKGSAEKQAKGKVQTEQVQPAK